ncbi:hypothetical protein FSP39_013333 [Pinctada imbricata]|uniref:Chloride channel protein n=1 Tax=Pinctada imbricata TaxID=66713 RepID=A0AA89BPJ9_PINIB|nr:hypothetical protein FSP39_013333 [Pinctada imbricata]
MTKISFDNTKFLINLSDDDQLSDNRNEYDVNSTQHDSINDDSDQQEPGQSEIPDENIISGEYESLDYDLCENILYQSEEKKRSRRNLIKIEFMRWLVMFFVGVLTGFVASFIDYSVVHVSDLKFKYVRRFVDNCVENYCLEQPYLIWIGFNGILVFVGALLTVYLEPVAAGSGIPQIKCYLNGVKVPHVVRLQTIFTKVVGVICAVGGGLFVGKEGPMIHSGAVIAAGISQGKLNFFRKFDFGIFEFFRTDTEKRDFVSGGAAAGVSAAFGAPVGGVLFSLEEGASFWNQGLTWRIFFASMISTFTLNIVSSYMRDHPWDLSYPGLFNFGSFDTTTYSGIEIPIFIVMGIIGGLLGALFNHINIKLTKYRRKYITNKWTRVVEAMMVAIMTGTISYLFLYINNDCKAMRHDQEEVTSQFFCNDGEYSSTASILFNTPEESLKKLFHEKPGTYQAGTLAVYCICVFLTACWTYGLFMPSGLFIPSLLIGAGWGRLFGVMLNYMFPGQTWIDFGKYALIGAAAQLGGIVRMTISLTVIVMEATGNITFGLPIMIVLMVAKWVGDLFNEGIYDMHIHLQGIPLLGWEPEPVMSNIAAAEVMSHPVTVFRTKESVGRIVEILKHEPHNGFPVVEDYDPFIEQASGMNLILFGRCRMRIFVIALQSSEGGAETFGTFQGTILRSQLIVLLKKKAFEEYSDSQMIKRSLTVRDFREAYPRFTPIHQISITPQERNFTIDLTPFMNPAAYTVTDVASFPRIFKLFRALGLRHVPVVDKRHKVVGIVTRKDLARYKVSRHFGTMSVGEKFISSK